MKSRFIFKNPTIMRLMQILMKLNIIEGKSNDEIKFYNITLSDKQKEINMKKKLGVKYIKP